MKNFLRVLTAFIAASTIFMIVGCSSGTEGGSGEAKTLKSIYIASALSKTSYTVGDIIDTTGLKVIALYSDNSETDVTKSVSISGFDSKTTGTKTVTVSYTEGSITKTATFTVSIISSGNNNNNGENNNNNGGNNNNNNNNDDTELIATGDIILSDGTIVKKASYTAIDSTNPPVAVVVEHNKSTNVTLGVGLYTSSEALEITPVNTYGYYLNFAESKVGSSSQPIQSAHASDATFGGYTNGSSCWSRIFNAKQTLTEDQNKYRWEVLNSKINFPAFYWVNTYGETYKEYLKDVTYGWYIPSISEMATIYNNLTKINATITTIQTLDANYTTGAIDGEYWSSSTCALSNVHNYADMSVWHINMLTGLMKYHYKTAKYNVLTVRSFKTDTSSTTNLSSIAITKAPEKTKYIVNSGATLDKTGLKVTAYYSDYTTKDVTNEITVDEENAFNLSSAVNTLTIKISYDGKTTQFPISVREPPVLQTLLVEGKQNYIVGEPIDITVKAMYSDNSLQDVTSSAVLTGFDSSSPAWNKQLSISYTEGSVTKNATYLISVNKYELGSIILSDGSVVGKDGYSYDVSNPPVAVVAGTTSTGKTLGVGLYATLRGTGFLKWTKKYSFTSGTFSDIVCSPTLSSYTVYNKDGYVGMNVAKDAIFEGDTNGSDNLAKIASRVYAYDIEDFPAFKWASSYGETFQAYLGGVTTGWYIPSLSELCTLYRNLETVNETLSAVRRAGAGCPSSYNDQVRIPDTSYWSSSPKQDTALGVWDVDFYRGCAREVVPSNVSSVLVVHAFD